MPLSFFSAKKDKKGAALFITVNSKEGQVYCRFKLQTGWNEKKGVRGVGSFKGGEEILLKFNPVEIGGILHAIKSKTKYEWYHSFGDNVNSGKFGYYELTSTDKKGDIKKGFGFSVKKGDTNIKLPLGIDGAELLSHFLDFCLTHIFNSIYAEDKKQALEYSKKQAETKEKVEEDGDFDKEEDNENDEDDEEDFDKDF